jgi:hypothetical protein
MDVFDNSLRIIRRETIAKKKIKNMFEKTLNPQCELWVKDWMQKLKDFFWVYMNLDEMRERKGRQKGRWVLENEN